MDLDKAREDKKSYTIEFLMGSPDDNAALFLCNGIQEGLQEYLYVNPEIRHLMIQES